MKILPIITEYIADLPYKPTHTDFPTGILKLDETAWFRRQNVNIIGGRTSNMKSSLALNSLAVPTAESGKTVFFYTLEDRKDRFAVRYLANKTNIVNFKIAQNNLQGYEIDTLYEHRDNLKDLPLHIIEDVGYKIDEIRKHIEKSEVKPDMVILDYLNKIYSNPGQSRLESINYYLREFSKMAKEFNFCGVVCCQINREAMGEGNKKEVNPPMLHHLKDSGEIEQIADLVIFLHWKYKYTGDTTFDKNNIEVIVAKNKDGDTGFIHCRVDPEYNRISNATQEYNANK